MTYNERVRSRLSDLQKRKLYFAAKMLKSTAQLYNNESNKEGLLPLWGGGIITHGVPKSKFCIIGITVEAKKVEKKHQTNDHLFRVTKTAEIILDQIITQNLSEEDIVTALIERSPLMITTREENNKILKNALRHCKNQDSWKELYETAGVEYELYNDLNK